MNEIISYYNLYQSHGFICFTANLKEEHKPNGLSKKTLGMPKGWSSITKDNMKKFVITRHNALCIKTGSDSGIIVIDWDLYKDNETLNLYNELINKYGKPNTFINKTGNGGEHWFFRYEHKKHSHITSHSDTLILGKKYAVDIKTNGGCIISPPTSYLSSNGIVKKYDNFNSIDYLSNVPDWIYDTFDSFSLNDSIGELVLDALRDDLDGSGTLRVFDDIKPSDSVSNIDINTQDNLNSNVSLPTVFNYQLEFKNDLLVLLECIKKERVDNYNDWLKIGFSLHSIKYLDTFHIWNEWSKKSSKYVSGECEKIWSSMKNSNEYNICTLGTLKYLAKLDDPSLYSQRFIKTNIFKEAMKIFNNYNVANLLFTYFDNYYMFDNIYDNWFELSSNNTWSISKKTPTSLLQVIQKDLIDKIYSYIGELSRIAPTLDFEHSKNINDLIKKCLNNTAILGSSVFINGVLQCTKYVFDNDKISIKMDTNRHIFAFCDLIYDLKTCSTRPIKPEDLITITTNYPFPKYNPIVEKEVLDFIHSIFENPDIEKYLLTTIASAILGFKRFEEFYVWTGRGRNGKGSLTELIKYAFGDYFKTIDMTFFTKLKKSSSDATPELADKKSCRILFSTEPEKCEQLMASKLKQITGNDEIHCRELYHNEVISFVPQFSLFLQTNDIPTLSKVDHAVISRMKIVHFPFVFTSNPREPHERLGRSDLKDTKLKSKEWRDAFILILLHYYEKYVKDANYLIPPKVVEDDSKNYFDEQNPLTDWFNTYCERKKFSSIGSTELYNHFINTSNSNVSQTKFAEYMKVLGFEPKKTKTNRIYEGITIKPLDIKDI
jgi:P4 family phage/plasmid primase-like protien